MDKYYFEMAIKFTSTNRFVLRYLRKIMNMLFNKNNKSKKKSDKKIKKEQTVDTAKSEK